ncbi:MAG TPA: WYL domain-containing protein, partial [Opitutaceae bacterium]
MSSKKSPRKTRSSSAGDAAPELPKCTASALFRVARIHEALLKGGRVTARALARELETSYPTIQRTLDLMRYGFKMPIKWDSATRSFGYEPPCPFLPIVPLAPEEALAVALANQTFAGWAGTPLARALNGALQKFSTVATGNLSVSRASMVTTPAALLCEAEQRHLGSVYEATQYQRELRVLYRKPESEAAEWRTIHPLHLFWPDHGWVVVLRDAEKRKMRTFRLSRIQQLETTGAAFERPADFDAADFLRGNLGAFTGDEAYEVRIKLRGHAAAQARERPWHASQQTREIAPGEIEITLQLNNLVDVEHAIL